MLNRMSFNISIVIGKEAFGQEYGEDVGRQILHILKQGLKNTIIERVSWEQTEGILPLAEDEEESDKRIGKVGEKINTNLR